MSEHKPLTYERVLKMFRRTEREMRRMSQETDRKFQETAKLMKETEKKISALGSRIGEIVEAMVEGRIIEKFQAFGYDVEECFPRLPFKNKKLGLDGEIDLLLEDGDTAILIEVKTTLETADVRKHLKRMEEYRLYADTKGIGKRRYIGAVAGAVVKGEAATVAHENGFYVIVQSGEAVEIVEPPQGFVAKEW